MLREYIGHGTDKIPLHRLTVEFSNIFSDIPPTPPDAPKYLFIAPRGLDYDLGFMGIISHRLKMENCQPHFLLCDNLPVCSMRDHRNSAKEVCDICVRRCVDFMQFNGFPYNSIWEYLETEDVKEARSIAEGVTYENFTGIKWNGYDIGLLQEIAAARYFFTGKLEESEFGLQTAKHFIYSAILLTKAYERAFQQIKPRKIILSNGKTNWATLALKVAEKFGIEYVNYENASPVAGCGRGNEYQFSGEGPMVDFRYIRSWEKWKDVSLTEEENAALDIYLSSRKCGSRYYPTQPKDKISEIEEELGVRLKSPLVTLFSNVVWDTSVLQKNNIFPNMFEWIKATIEEAKGKDYTLLIRVHPAEKVIDGFESRQKVTDEIAKYYPILPENVKIIPPDSKISSYTLIAASDFCIAYTSTIGIESVIAGKPVLVCGLPHYFKRGFTIDLEEREQYFAYLRHPADIPAATQKMSDYARRYIYMFTFRCLIPLKFFGTKKLWDLSHYTITDIKEIKPGANPYFDLIIEGIVRDGDFSIPRELDYFEIIRSERLKNPLKIVDDSRIFLNRLESISGKLSRNPADSTAQQELQALHNECGIGRADDQRINDLFAQSKPLYERGKLDDTIECLERIFELNPNHPGALTTLAKIYIDNLRPDEAEPLLIRACYANPQDNECWRWLVNVCKIRNDLKKEIVFTQNWLNANPDSIPALLQALSVIIKDGDITDLANVAKKIVSFGGHPTAEKILEALGFLIPPKAKKDAESEITQEETSPAIKTKTSSKPEISVLLCSYNGGKKLPTFFEAMKRQTLGKDKFEIICVNDGSTDNTGESMQEALGNLPGSYHQHPVNRALAAARNTAIDAARGRLLLFVNDDTYPEPDCLQRHIDFHHSLGKSNIAALGSVKFTENVKDYVLSRVIEKNNLLFPLVGTEKGKEYNFNHFVTANLSVHKALFTDNQIKFDTSFRKYGCEDIELAYRLWQKGMRVMFNPEALVRHEHYMSLDDYIRREDNNNSNLVQFVEMHPELLKDLFQTAKFDENVIRQWREEIAAFTPQFENLVNGLRPWDKVDVEKAANLPNGNPDKLLEEYASALQTIRQYIKFKAILETLEVLPETKDRLLKYASGRG